MSGFASGEYIHKPLLSDTIELNEYWLDQYTLSKQKYVALHELGHALGLAHSYNPNVMVQGEYSLTELGSHDEYDYYDPVGGGDTSSTGFVYVD